MFLETYLNPSFLKKLEIVDLGVFSNSIPESFEKYSTWTNQNTELSYLTDIRKENRQNLANIFPEFKSGASFLFSYAPTKKFLNQENFHQVSSYTLHFDEADYHFVLGKRLKEIGEYLQSHISGLVFEVCLDTKPILERDFAYQAGLGWFGKNSMLINRQHGSYFLIGTLLFNQKFSHEEKKPIELDHCGNCRACVEACPTDAINEAERTISLKDCLSYYSIEVFKEGEVPPKIKSEFQNEIFGCEICQEVCPWNEKPLSRINVKIATGKLYSFFSRPLAEVAQRVAAFSNSQYRKFFFGSSFYRSGKRGLVKNFKNLLFQKKSD
ncbi:DUF1730 domain-containing protein [Bacteriovoracaceae bacterium]|nr:DUF1730 domain-containing protein [Bacteriovoracaceae bacterium]